MTCKGCNTFSDTINTQRQPTSPFAQYAPQSDIDVLGAPTALQGNDVADYPVNPQHANYPIFQQSQGAGHTHVYPQAAGTPSAKSDADIWRHLDTWVWGKTGEKGAIKPMIEGGFNSLQDQINAAKAERDLIQEQKAPIGHSHGGGNGGCEWWDIGCHTAGGFQSIGLLAVLGVVGYVLYKKAT